MDIETLELTARECADVYKEMFVGLRDDAPSCSADLLPEQIELAERLGSFLWESSTLRHGLFTPPEFSRLVRERIKQYFYEQNREYITTCQKWITTFRGATS